MNSFKKPAALLLCMVLLFAFAACKKDAQGDDTTTKAPVSTKPYIQANEPIDSAQKFADTFFAPLTEKSINWNSFWSDNVAAKTKELEGVDDSSFALEMRRRYASTGYESFELLACEDMGDYYRLDMRFIKKAADGKDLTAERTEYLVEEDGEYKLLYGGYTGIEFYDGSVSKSKLSIEKLELRHGLDKTSLIVTIVNNSKAPKGLGVYAGAQLEYESSSGKFEGNAAQMLVVKAGETITMKAELPGASGEFKQLSIGDVYPFGSNDKIDYAAGEEAKLTISSK